ncbi:MAG: CubicO group peptidase (beta-lactamase class C family) [Enterobacterales bacterium]
MKILTICSYAMLFILPLTGCNSGNNDNQDFPDLSTDQLTKSNELALSFQEMDKEFPTISMAAAEQPHVFYQGVKYALPEKFSLESHEFTSKYFIEETKTSGLLIIQDELILYEQYFLGNTATTRHISWSIAKSVVSALVGIAVDKGLIYIENTATDYVPMLMGSGYENVRIKDLLQMSSGVSFDETYEYPNSDINRFNEVMNNGASYEAFAASLERENEPGTVNKYNSIDTLVLGMVLKRATNQSLSQFMEQNLWRKIGAEHSAYWITDNLGVELALGGLNATLRDYARFGLLYLNGGQFNGQQIISEQWVQDSLIADAPHLYPKASGAPGYGYQWWLPESDQGEFLAIGIYGQFIYVNPEKKLIIVKNSADDKFAENDEARDALTLQFFRKIASQL